MQTKNRDSNKTTMIRVSRETRDLVDANKISGESQSDCIKRIVHNISTKDLNPRESIFREGYTLIGFREYSYDRNNTPFGSNRQPDYIQLFEVSLKKEDSIISVKGVTLSDLEKMKMSRNILVEFYDEYPAKAFVSISE
jgi:hypothetical protein